MPNAVADAHWGRYKTIHAAIVCALVGHVILTASAAPSVIAHGSSALAAFAIGLIILGVGTGGFKSNISPLLAEQQTDVKKRIEVLPSGERVIVDPAVTTSRIFLYFYLCINVGSLVGQIGMVRVLNAQPCSCTNILLLRSMPRNMSASGSHTCFQLSCSLPPRWCLFFAGSITS
jgi:dipeptide/tripeptide permease